MAITLLLRRCLYIDTSSGSYMDLPYQHMGVEYWHTDNTRTTFPEEKNNTFKLMSLSDSSSMFYPNSYPWPTYPGLLRWRHNEHHDVSNNQPLGCLLNCLFRCRSKETSKLCVTGLCGGNSPVTGEFPAQRISNAENVSIWWRHHALPTC